MTFPLNRTDLSVPRCLALGGLAVLLAGAFTGCGGRGSEAQPAPTARVSPQKRVAVATGSHSLAAVLDLLNRPSRVYELEGLDSHGLPITGEIRIGQATAQEWAGQHYEATECAVRASANAGRFRTSFRILTPIGTSTPTHLAWAEEAPVSLLSPQPLPRSANLGDQGTLGTAVAGSRTVVLAWALHPVPNQATATLAVTGVIQQGGQAVPGEGWTQEYLIEANGTIREARFLADLHLPGETPARTALKVNLGRVPVQP